MDEADWGGGSEHTVIRTRPAHAGRPPRSDWRHSLVVVEGGEPGRRIAIGAEGLQIGRRAPAGLLVPEPEVSAMHCRIELLPGRDTLRVVDLQSTNGSFIDGRRLAGQGLWAPGSILQVGSHLFRHDFEPPALAEAALETERELERASHYVNALLPPPLRTEHLEVDWFFQPSARLGGDAFGYQALDERHFAGFVIDTCGHGAGAAMHTVSVVNVLRQRALPGTDFTQPAQVLARLNAMFDMERHDGLYFTLWYGVYDKQDRELRYAAAGHHAALLRAPGSTTLERLATRNPMIGVLPDAAFVQAATPVAPGSRLYVFSDGLFEVVSPDGRERGFDDFAALLLDEPEPAAPREPERLFRRARAVARPGLPEDDCSLVVVTFLS